MRPPRRLSSDETALWRKVAETVTPLERRPRANPIREEVPAPPQGAPATTQPPPVAQAPRHPAPARVSVHPPATRRAAPPRPGEQQALDGSWERKFARGTVDPDFSLDLHGATLDQAYMRLMRGLTQAKAMQARVMLVVTGKARPIEAADRGKARGAIRAKMVDWLAASEHASDVAAIRGAHRRHGGPGALYIVLKRRR